MKRLKKGLCVLLMGCMVFSSMTFRAKAAVISNGEYGENIYWELEDTGVLTISGTGEMPDLAYNAYASTPWYSYEDYIKEIVIADGITYIGDNTFRTYDKVTKLEMANSVTGIGTAAFYSMKALSQLSLSENLTTMGTHVFYDCDSLVRVELPWQMSEVEGFTFADCEKLEMVILQGPVTKIGYNAFENCSSFWGLSTMGNYLRTIERCAFKNCTSLKSMGFSEGVSEIGNNAFEGCIALVDVSFPSSITSIGDYAFHMCNSLVTIRFPESGDIRVGDVAFGGCYALSSVFLPKSITYLGIEAFGGCPNLTEATFYHEDEDRLEFDESTGYAAFAGSPVSTIYVVDKTDVHPVVQQIGNSSSETVTYENIFSGYRVGIVSLESEMSVGGELLVHVQIDHSLDNSFNASELKITYDTTKFALNQDGSRLGTATLSDKDGVIIMEDYGEDKDFGRAVYVLAFTAISDGTATITMTSAAFADSEDAVRTDLLEAMIDNPSLTITIAKKQLEVTLPLIFEGSSTVTMGDDYVFSVADGANYDYDAVTATMNGQSVGVINNGDGTYTIENVTGPLVITGTRTEKTYQVTFTGNAAEDIIGASDEATYNTAYSFTMPTEEGWAYSLDSIVIGETAYTGYEVLDGVYTIAGTAIKGDILITVSKVQIAASVTVEGTGAGAAAGYEVSVNLGEDYTLTIAPEVGYAYSVAATVDGESVEVIDNGDNTYTVKAVSGALVFTVNRTVVVSGVEVVEYLTINSSKMWLIKNATTVADCKVPTYDGEAMFWSEQYDAYCYLVIAPTMSQEEAAAKVGIVEGTTEVVDYGKDGKDVNGTGKVDAADAQLVYDIYNAKYTEFTGDVTMEKFLRADVNGVDGVTVEDAAAIINSLLS